MTIDDDFKELDKILIKCINKGFDNLILVQDKDYKVTENYLVNKLKALTNIIEEGLID